MSYFVRGVVAVLPNWLVREGPFALAAWQWLAVPALVLAGVALGRVASRLLLALLGAATRRTASAWDDELLQRLTGPLTAALAVTATVVLLPLIDLPVAVLVGLRHAAQAFLLLALFWGIWRVIDVGRHLALQSAWAIRVPSSRALVPLGARSAKVLVVIIAVIAVLSLYGYPVASLVAGLGIGGLAVALAAQKTVENLFGAFSIGVDQPFREGDFVKIEDFVGTVEAIGLRSTRFRTLDRTIVTIPNGRLAEMRLESFTERDRLRLATVIGLVYDTSAAQLREIRDAFEAALRAHPMIWPDAVVVRFREFASSSLDIEVMAWFRTSDWAEFQRIREGVLIQFMEIVERAGSSFAFPTRTVHLARGAADAPVLPGTTERLTPIVPSSESRQ
jgi:MscS family membrane protein